MIIRKKIRFGTSHVEALSVNLSSKNLVLLKGRRGFVMCGYLDLKACDKFGDIAVRITGVSSIEDALSARVESCSKAARKLGIHKDQPIREVVRILA